MSHSAISESYEAEGIRIEEVLIEIRDGEYEWTSKIALPDADTMILVQTLAGDLTIKADVPLEKISTTPAGQIFTGSTNPPAKSSGPPDEPSFFVNLAAKGYAKARVVFAQVRKGLVSTFRAFPCRLCKMAVKTIVSTLLVKLGVPISPTGEFDLRSVIAAFKAVGTNITEHAYGQVFETLWKLLPEGWWTIVLNALHAANWFLEATDRFFAEICVAIGMCPKQAS